KNHFLLVLSYFGVYWCIKMDNNTSYQRERTAMRMGQLVLKKLDRQLSDAEASELDQWIASAAEYRAVHDEMMDALSRSRAVLYQPPHDADAVLQHVLDRHAQRTSKKHFPLRRLLPYAAAA